VLACGLHGRERPKSRWVGLIIIVSSVAQGRENWCDQAREELY
jgi:hypothetical protein